MNIDGLRAILEKDEIVPTRIARDFLGQSQEIEDLYKHHVRTYIPLQTGSDEASGVSAFSKKFIRQVKEKRSPRGYITADFGYGKTSAGLFVWQQAQESRLIAVPPFKLNRLEDLLDATAGWVAHILQKSTPRLVDRVISTYRFYHDRELQSIAQRYGVSLEQTQQMYDDQTLQLSITPRDIVRFFMQMTEIVLEAGFDGLVVLSDELQQYLEPEIKSGKVDPFVPLFDIVSELMEHQQAFGLILIITSKELGVINDQRGDLIDRMRGNTLDLRAIYDQEFPTRLWSRFAETFDFQKIAPLLIDDLTLVSIGEIASRQDLSNGPRTVINIFRRIAQRTIAANGTNLSPYTPIDLINDFLSNNIAFDARKLLQEATNRALSAGIVRNQPELEPAVKLLAAFPTNGANREVQDRYHLKDACSQLKLLGSPEIVIEAGDRDQPALVLRGLQQSRENTDELTLILSEFARNYEPHAANQIERAVNAFARLLSDLIFKGENWTLQSTAQRHFMQNAELLLEGAFPDMARKFPERQVYVCVLGDDETSIERKSSAECTLIFVLNRHFDVSRVERQSIFGSMQIDENQYAVSFQLNLMIPCFDGLNRSIQDQLRRVVDVEDVNVLMILALHEFLQNAVERDGVSKPLKEMIQRSMTVRLLETSMETLLNPAVGSALSLAGPRIVEHVVGILIEARYGDQYQTLMTYKQWRDRLRDYISALNQLPSFAQKQGYAPVKGKKEEIAKFFGTTAASFDAFQSRFSDLIQIEDSFSRGATGSVRFTRHPLEETIFASLEDSLRTVKRNGESRKALDFEYIHREAAELGYRDDEVKYVLQIMEARNLIEVDSNWIVAKPRPNVTPRKILERIAELKNLSEMLVQANEQQDAKQMLDRAKRYANRFQELDEHQNEIELLILSEQVEGDLVLLTALIDREIETTQDKITSLRANELALDGAEILSETIDIGALTADINQIRARYEQSFVEWRQAVMGYNERLVKLSKYAESLKLQDLQHVHEQISQLMQSARNLRDQRHSLSNAVSIIRGWHEASSVLVNLHLDIQRLGNQGELPLKELEKDTLEAFCKNAEETFAYPSRYKNLLLSLRQQITQSANKAEDEFNQRQNVYREMFVRYAGVTHESLWNKIFYSPSNMKGVYDYLQDEVNKQTATLLDKLYQEIEYFGNDIFALEQKTDAGSPDYVADLSKLKQNLQELNDQYTYLTEKIDSSIIQETGELRRWLEKFANVLQLLSNTRALIQKTHTQPETPPFSPDEQALLNSIAGLGTSGNLIRVRQDVSDLGDEVFWQLLRELWQKRIIEINVKNLR